MPVAVTSKPYFEKLRIGGVREIYYFEFICRNCGTHQSCLRRPLANSSESARKDLE